MEKKISNTKENKNKIVLGLPKGSLQEATAKLFEKAGFEISIPERSYFPSINDPEIECILLRAQEIAGYVEAGILDAGITGYDWIQETRADVHEVEEFIYGKKGFSAVKWILAVANESPIKSVQDLEGKRIATETMNLTKNFLKEKGVNAKVEFSWGATEIKARGLVDAIVDVTETGSSLKANNLRVIDTILESTTRLIANNDSIKNEWKKNKIYGLALLLKGVMLAEKKVLMMMNVKKEDVENVTKALPALNTPTITQLTNPDWFDVITVVDKLTARDITPKLKMLGARDILEIPINRIII